MASKILTDPDCLDKFSSVLAGVGTVAAGGIAGSTGAIGGAVIAAGILQIGCGGWSSTLQYLRGQKSDASGVLHSQLNATRKNWRKWTGTSAIRDPKALKSAILCFEEYFRQDKTAMVPRPDEIIAIGRDAQKLTLAMLARAAGNTPDCYADKPINSLARKFFRDVTQNALERLFADPDFATLLQPAFQNAVITSLSHIETMVEDIQQTLNEQNHGLPLLAAQKLAVSFGAQIDLLVDPGKIEPFLQAKAIEYDELKARLSAPSNEDDPHVQKLRAEAAGLIEAGEFDAADARLHEAGKYDEAEEHELEATLARRKRSRAKSRFEQGDLAKLRLAYRDAADHYAAAASIVASDDIETQWHYQLACASVLGDLGKEFGDNAALTDAISLYREVVLPLVNRERVPLDWAMTQNNLGTVLATLGQRESGTERLEQALEAYGEALKEYTRIRVPLDWAMTQNNLGNVLATLGERESGTERLEQALEAYDEALKERTRERVPLNWATTQNNLGIVLATLGQRASGTKRLEQALEAYGEALKEYTRERVPLNWATTQNNLGTVLATLGERESGTERLEQALVAYKEALKERTRERVPLDWAGTQNNLGAVLATLGERESNTERLEQALEAYNEALKERTRERVPLNWATTSGNQGRVLMEISRRTGNLKTAKLALEQITTAFEMMSESGHIPHANFYEQTMLGAQALVEKLRKS